MDDELLMEEAAMRLLCATDLSAHPSGHTSAGMVDSAAAKG
jgi:hypothetical protein